MFQKGRTQIGNIQWADSCTSVSFFGKIVSPGYSDFSHVHTCPGGDLILVGTAKDNFAQLAISRNYGHIMRITSAGDSVWSRFIGITDPAVQVDLRTYASVVTSNGDIVVVLAVNAAALSGNYIIRIRGDGTLAWQKRLPYVNPALPFDVFIDVIETAGQGLLITGSTDKQGIIMKLTGDGVFQWRNVVTSGDVTTNILAVTESPSAFYISGSGTSILNNNIENFIIKADKLIGNITWIKWISFFGTVPLTAITEYEFDQLHYKDGVVALTGSTRSNYTGIDRNAQVAVYMDENANVISSIRIENMETEMDPAYIYQGSLYDPFTKTAVQSRFSGSNEYYVFRLKNDINVRWAWKIPVSDIHSVMDSKVLNDSSFVVAGLSRDANNIVSANVLKTSAAGKLENCTNLPFPFIVSTQLVSLPNIPNIQVSYNISEQTIPSNLNMANSAGINWQLQCSNTNVCLMSKIDGAKNVCKDSSNLFSVTRSGNCNNPITFSGNGPVTVSNNSDSSAIISFSSEGTFVLYAEMQSACGLLKDSIIVRAKKSGAGFSLGPDTAICSGNTIRIKAASDFQTYLWQDGSADSVYTVTAPGRYYVTVTDACGKSFSDTINVNPVPPFAFSIGPDRIKCNTDTLHISGPAGFSDYHWLPQYNISSIQSQDVIVNPFTDTTYTVVAEKYPGCLAFDTIKVQVKHSPVINIGRDTSICAGDTLLLNAGPGFTSYLWNNGKTTAVNIITAPGIYSVSGYYDNGCQSSDSISINNNLCPDDIYVPSAFTPNNDGLNDIFKPVCSRPLTQFHFEIYNRWGGQIFETTDINKGWNGYYKGSAMGENVFVWICVYQFEGEKKQGKKGAVLLIR